MITDNEQIVNYYMWGCKGQLTKTHLHVILLFMSQSPERKREYMREYMKKNRDKKLAYSKKYWIKNRLKELAKRKIQYASSPELRAESSKRSREWRLKNLFGITVEQYEKILTSQNGKCAICKDHNRWYIEGRKHYNLAIDHSHSTGLIRGLLCNRCNLCLGWFEDNRIAIFEQLERVIDVTRL